MMVIKAIDLDKLRADRLQLWGEAAHDQSRGECLTIDEAMWPDAGIEQEKRRVKDPWEPKLANMPIRVETKEWDAEEKKYVASSHRITYVFDDDDVTGWSQERVASEHILTHVLELPIAHQTTAHTMRLANVMKALGWERTSNGKVTIDGQRVRGYFRWVESAQGTKTSSAPAPDAAPAEKPGPSE